MDAQILIAEPHRADSETADNPVSVEGLEHILEAAKAAPCGGAGVEDVEPLRADIGEAPPAPPGDPRLPDPVGWLSIEGAAIVFGVKPRKIRRLVKKRLVRVRLEQAAEGSRWLIDMEEVRAHLGGTQTASAAAPEERLSRLARLEYALADSHSRLQSAQHRIGYLEGEADGLKEQIRLLKRLLDCRRPAWSDFLNWFLGRS